MNVKQIISKYNIPKSTVAQIADVKPYDFSLYLRDRSLVTAVKADRIEQAITDIRYVLDTYDQARAEINGPSLSLNLRDTDALKKLIDFCKSHSETLTEESAANLFSFLGKS